MRGAAAGQPAAEQAGCDADADRGGGGGIVQRAGRHLLENRGGKGASPPASASISSRSLVTARSRVWPTGVKRVMLCCSVARARRALTCPGQARRAGGCPGARDDRAALNSFPADPAAGPGDPGSQTGSGVDDDREEPGKERGPPFPEGGHLGAELLQLAVDARQLGPRLLFRR